MFKILFCLCICSSLFAQKYLEQGKELFNNRKYKECQNLLSLNFSKIPKKEQAKAKLYIAYSMQKQKHLDDAIKVFEEVSTQSSYKDMHKSEALVALGNIYKKNPIRASSYFWRVLATTQASITHKNKANAYIVDNISKDFILPETSKSQVIDKNIVGLVKGNNKIFFSKKSGLPIYFETTKNKNLLLNNKVNYPLWQFNYFDTKTKKIVVLDSSSVKKVDFSFGEDYIKIKYIPYNQNLTQYVEVKVIMPKNNSFPSWHIFVEKGKNNKLNLWEVQFPKFATKLNGDIKSTQVTIPWRNGRIWPIERFLKPEIQLYPGSSARFQFISCFDNLKNGIYFSTYDAEGYEKKFTQFYQDRLKVLTLNATVSPLNRGIVNNSCILPYPTILASFSGDYYDAAKIYRKWWQKQSWAKQGHLGDNKNVPQWLIKAPVFLQFYLRKSRNLGVEKNKQNALEWAKFLDNRPTPGTLYHYSKFKEPANKSRYPVAEYYGFNAEPYPHLIEMLEELKAKNILPNVYLQSEIYNQDDKRNFDLKDACRLDYNGNVEMYLNERYRACRGSEIWQNRFLSMGQHVFKIGFSGIYIDTFGKNKLDTECFNTNHNHAKGGGNVDLATQRDMGIKVRNMVKKYNKDFYIGGESCGEAYTDILDYKLNATHIYKGELNIERILYGDYILSHGRTMRGNDEENDRILMLSDFSYGIIPGRFLCSGSKNVPKSKESQELLKSMINFTENALDYLRTGEMLRTLKFAEKISTQSVRDNIIKSKYHLSLPTLRNTVFKSHKDNSIGIAVVNFSSKDVKNSLIISKENLKEWNLPKDAKIYSMDEYGKIKEIGLLNNIKNIPIEFKNRGILFFKTTPTKN